MAWLGFVVGVLGSHLLTVFPPVALSAGLTGLGAVVWLLGCRPARPRVPWQQALLLAAVGLMYGCWQHQQQLDERFTEAWLSTSLPAQLQVVGLPREQNGRQQVDARLLLEGQTERRVVSVWPAGHPPLRVGERWQAEVRLSSLRGLANFHGFDNERLAWSRAWAARAEVRDPVRLVSEPTPWHWEAKVNQWRDHWRQAMTAMLEGKTWGPVLVALALGDQAGVQREHWELFRHTGITHLISISGIHVTMLALMVAAAVSWGWRRCAWRGVCLAEWLPAQWAAASVGLVIAALYCMLAGWGVPAQRTWLMLAIMALGQWGQHPLTFWQRWWMAAAVIVMLDPAAVLGVGFWLSFGAVALLIWSSAGRWRKSAESRWLRCVSWLKQAAQMQLAISVGMIPLSIVFFNQVSWISPVANALAIPLMTWVITPLSLLGLCLLMVGAPDAWVLACLTLAHDGCTLQMQGLSRLADLPGASMDWPQVHRLALLPVCCGVLIVLAPRGAIPRHWGLALMLGVLIPAAPRLATGEWELVALDVGQGSALVLRYQGGALLFDTGPGSSSGWTAAETVLLPHLRGEGIQRLDALIVSHEDQDHAAGIETVLAAVPVDQAYSSFPVQQEGRGWQRCQAGQRWVKAGLEFRFLHPDATSLARFGQAGDRPNARSCVLEVSGPYHRLVFTGDIGQQEERTLLAAGIEPADVVVAAHHGSRSSSSSAWVRQMQAKIVLVQAGYRNRYGHPHPMVVSRWQASGAWVYRSDQHGAVRLHSSASGLRLVSRRQGQPRYWRSR